jgi:hypothetical protein
MENLNIVSYTLETIKVYPNIMKTLIIRNFENKGFVTKVKIEDEDNKEVKPVYIGNIPSNSRLDYSISQNNFLVKEIEYWEFKKSYKYSMIFNIEQFDNNIINNLLDNGTIKDYKTYKEDEYENLNNEAIKPSHLIFDKKIYLKFNFHLHTYDTTGNEINNRYPVLLILDNENHIIEYRFDSMNAAMSKDKLRYVKPVMAWVDTNIGVNKTNIDFEKIVSYAEEHKKDDHVSICGQDMYFKSGGNATIDTGKDDSMVLPFIGELKKMITDNEEEFNKSPIIKDLIIDFIEEKENFSSIPWAKLYFQDMNIKAKFTYNYNSEDLSIIQHFYSSLISNTGKERMDYVTDYIIKTRDNIAKLKVKQG